MKPSDAALDNLYLCSSCGSKKSQNWKMLTAFEKIVWILTTLSCQKKSPKSFLHDWQQTPNLLPHAVQNAKEFQWLIFVIEINWSATFWLIAWYRRCMKLFGKHFRVLSSYLLRNSSLGHVLLCRFVMGCRLDTRHVYQVRYTQPQRHMEQPSPWSSGLFVLNS